MVGGLAAAFSKHNWKNFLVSALDSQQANKIPGVCRSSSVIQVQPTSSSSSFRSSNLKILGRGTAWSQIFRRSSNGNCGKSLKEPGVGFSDGGKWWSSGRNWYVVILLGDGLKRAIERGGELVCTQKVRRRSWIMEKEIKVGIFLLLEGPESEFGSWYGVQKLWLGGGKRRLWRQIFLN